MIANKNIKSLLMEDEILTSINIGKISMRYFGKSASWLYHKLDGTDGRIATGFSEEELQTLKGALCDLADRLRKSADKL